MENYFDFDWNQEPALAHCQTGVSTDISNTTPFEVPNLTPSHLQSESSSPFQLHGYSYGFPIIPSLLEPFVEDDRAAPSASKNHSQAEKRRRDRINAHLASLRKLVPKSDKMDKASLLGKVVEQVKELKSEAMEMSRVLTLPADTDEVTVESESSDLDSDQIKASICCDDRPEIILELKNALKGLKLSIVEAHMSSLGGRIQAIFILCNEDKEEAVEMDKIKQSLRLVLTRIAFTTSNYPIKSKRQRFFSS